MLAAFQGFTTLHGGKKTRQDAQVVCQQLLKHPPKKGLQQNESDAAAPFCVYPV